MKAPLALSLTAPFGRDMLPSGQKLLLPSFTHLMRADLPSGTRVILFCIANSRASG